MVNLRNTYCKRGPRVCATSPPRASASRGLLVQKSLSDITYDRNALKVSAPESGFIVGSEM